MRGGYSFQWEAIGNSEGALVWGFRLGGWVKCRVGRKEDTTKTFSNLVVLKEGELAGEKISGSQGGGLVLYQREGAGA